MTPPQNRYPHFPRLRVGMFPIDIVGRATSAQLIIDLALTRTPIAVRLCNTSSLTEYHADPGYRRVMESPGLNLADGTPLVWLSYLAGPRRRRLQKVRGPTLMLEVLAAGREVSLRHALVGATPEILDLLEHRIVHDYPEVKIATKYAPPLSPDPDVLVASIAEALADEQFDLVWLGLGSPKQDFVSLRLTDRMRVTCLGVGAAFDFAARTTAEAPIAVRAIGMEWLFRLIHEPRRLWKRYAKAFVYLTIAVGRHGVKQA